MLVCFCFLNNLYLYSFTNIEYTLFKVLLKKLYLYFYNIIQYTLFKF
jgi:hypothetical protein